MSNTKSCIQLDEDIHTNWFENISGVRQGDSLSPTIFSLYINDLVDTLKENGPFIVKVLFISGPCFVMSLFVIWPNIELSKVLLEPRTLNSLWAYIKGLNYNFVWLK